MDFEKFLKDKLGEVMLVLWQLDFQVRELSKEVERLRSELPAKE